MEHSPFVISTGVVFSGLLLANIFWVKRLIHKIDKIDELTPLIPKVHALETLVLNLNGAVSKMQGYLEGSRKGHRREES
jgi:hypothetical protein